MNAMNYLIPTHFCVFAVLCAMSSCDSKRTKDAAEDTVFHRGRQSPTEAGEHKMRHQQETISSEEATEVFRASDGLAQLEGASFAGALKMGRAMIENEAISSSELMDFFASLRDIAKSEKLRTELIAHYAAQDLDQALNLAAMVPPGRLAPRVYMQIANLAEPTRLLDVIEAAQNSGLSEVLRVVNAESASRILTLNDADLRVLQKDPRSTSFAGPLEQRQASLDYEKHGLRTADFVGEGSLAYRAEILRRSAIDSPEKSAKWVKENLEAVEPCLAQRQELIGFLVNGYLAKSPATAMDWATSLDSSQVAALAVRTGIDSWLQLDSVAASQWVVAQPAGQARDVSALAIAQHLYNLGDIAGAKSWASAVKTEPYAKAARSMLGGHL